MNDEQLIRSLVSNLTPVRRLPSINLRLAVWSAFAITSVSLGVQLFGVRPDLASKLCDSAYLREGLALIALFGLAGRAALEANIPGATSGGLRRALPFVALGVWLALIAERAPLMSVVEPPESGFACVFRTLCLAALPLVALCQALRAGAHFASSRMGALATLAAGAGAVLGTQAICAKDGAQHVLLWHFMPLICAAALGATWHSTRRYRGSPSCR